MDTIFHRDSHMGWADNLGDKQIRTSDKSEKKVVRLDNSLFVHVFLGSPHQILEWNWDSFGNQQQNKVG
jgi:hypothetical protein